MNLVEATGGRELEGCETIKLDEPCDKVGLENFFAGI